MSLFASFDTNFIANFGNAAQFKGCLGYSITELDSNLNLTSTKWYDGNWNSRNIPENSNYKICFMKHPSALRDSNEDYPHMQDDQFLWYEGFMKKHNINENGIASTFIEALNSKIPEGIYSYLWIKDGELFCGKDLKSSLFINKDLSISTLKFYGSVSIQPNICWNIDFKDNSLKFSWSHQ